MSDAASAFATYGGSFAKPTRPARSRALLQVQKDDAQLRKEATAADRRQLAEIMASPHGPVIGDLRQTCRRLALDGAPGLVAYVEKAHALRAAPTDIRYLALRIVDKAIVRVRLRAGLPPFDDGLPGDAPRAMHVIRDLLGVR